MHRKVTPIPWFVGRFHDQLVRHRRRLSRSSGGRSGHRRVFARRSVWRSLGNRLLGRSGRPGARSRPGDRHLRRIGGRDADHHHPASGRFQGVGLVSERSRSVGWVLRGRRRKYWPCRHRGRSTFRAPFHANRQKICRSRITDGVQVAGDNPRVTSGDTTRALSSEACEQEYSAVLSTPFTSRIFMQERWHFTRPGWTESSICPQALLGRSPIVKCPQGGSVWR